MEGTLFHPAKRECLNNAEVWKDGFCPLLSASEEEDNNTYGDDEGSGMEMNSVNGGDDGEEHKSDESNNDMLDKPSEEDVEAQDQKADIKIKSDEEAEMGVLIETPKTAELEDPVSHRAFRQDSRGMKVIK